ncbi:MAG: hypothetical protein KAU35_10600 [candidate division Zixibacteria bacterium]|nr:hypothetical protein [candidate division Zixibacteria bacterium]
MATSKNFDFLWRSDRACAAMIRTDVNICLARRDHAFPLTPRAHKRQACLQTLFGAGVFCGQVQTSLNLPPAAMFKAKQKKQ